MVLLDGFFEIRRERRLVETEMGEYALLVGRALRGPISDIRRERGMERALELIDDVNVEEESVAVRWVWFDAEPGDPAAPGVPRDLLPETRGDGGSRAFEGADDDERLYSYVAVEVPGPRRGGLELSESLHKRDARTTFRIERLSLLLGGLLGISAVTIFWFGMRLVGEPLAQLAAKAGRVGAGDLSGPLELEGAAELEDLARSLNRMCGDLSAARDRLQAEAEQKLEALNQLRHADRLRTVGRLASGIAHEMGTPLSVVSGRAALIQRGTMTPEQASESAQIIRSQADRMTHIIRQLLDFARRGTSEKRVLDVNRVATSTCELVTAAARRDKVVLEPCFADGRPHLARINESEIQQVVTNLLMNAIQSMPSGGTIRVEVCSDRVIPKGKDTDEPAPYVRVDIVDQGEGIDEEDLPHLLEPFFTTKDVGSGTGLGLSIVHGIVDDHRGWIEIESQVGQGSRFTFFLPEEQP